MIILFANDKQVRMGGVESFNSNLEILLKDREIPFFRARSNLRNVYTNFVIRMLLTISFALKQNSSRCIIHHSNFLDVLFVLFYSCLTFKRSELISHVGENWKHISNPLLRRISYFILSVFCLKIYYIADKQLDFLPIKKCKKVHSVINGEFASDKTYDRNPVPRNVIDAGYVLFLGRVCERKGVSDLIEAFSRVNNDLYLVIAGPVEEFFLKKIARKHPKLIDKKIIFLGPVYDLEKKISLIDQCLFMTYPSYEDAFPITVIECFARGKLMLCTNISETKNFVVSNDLLFSPGDIDYLRNFFEFFNSKKNLNNYFDVVEEMKASALKYARGEILIDIFGKD